MVSPYLSHYNSICTWPCPRSSICCLSSALFSDPSAGRRGRGRGGGHLSAPRLQLPAWFGGLCYLSGRHPTVGTQQSAFHATSTWGVHGGLCPLETHGCTYAFRDLSRMPPGRASPARFCPPPHSLESGPRHGRAGECMLLSLLTRASVSPQLGATRFEAARTCQQNVSSPHARPRGHRDERRGLALASSRISLGRSLPGAMVY